MKTIAQMLVYLLLTAFSCQAVVFYEWKDDKGVLHFTDDLKKVPSRFQDKVHKRDMGPEPSPAPEGATGGPVPERQTPEAAGGAGTGVPTYGGHEGGWWQNRYRILRAQLAGMQQGLAAKEQNRVELHRRRVLFSRPQDRVAENQLNAEIEQDQARMKEIQQGLEALDAEANDAGVPAQWR